MSRGSYHCSRVPGRGETDPAEKPKTFLINIPGYLWKGTQDLLDCWCFHRANVFEANLPHSSKSFC